MPPPQPEEWVIRNRRVSGKMTFNEVLALYRERLRTNINLKPRSKEYLEERISALLKSWPDLKDKDL